MMDETTYLSGREAVDLGFADEVMEDAEDPDIAVSADHRYLSVSGHRMRIAAMGKLPEGILVKEIDAETTPEQEPEENRPDWVTGLENELLAEINRLPIGPAGLGGSVTALSLRIETYPTHIASLPVAVNTCCHVNRHITRRL